MVVQPHVIKAAEDLRDQFIAREKIWGRMFRTLNHFSAPYDGGKTPGQRLETLSVYESLYKNDLREQATYKRGAGYAASFKDGFTEAREKLVEDLKGGTRTSTDLAALYAEQTTSNDTVKRLVGSIRTSVSSYANTEQASLLRKIEKALTDGNYERARGLIPRGPEGVIGKASGLLRSFTGGGASRAFANDIKTLHTIVTDCEKKLRNLETLDPHISKVEKATAAAIQKNMRYSLTADKLFEAGKNHDVDTMAKTCPDIALLQRYQGSTMGLSQGDIIKAIRAEKGGISLDTLVRNMTTCEASQKAGELKAKSNYAASFEKYYDTKEFDKSCRHCRKLEMSIPNNSLRYESAIDVLNREIAEAKLGNMTTEDLQSVIDRAQKRQTQWHDDPSMRQKQIDAANLGSWDSTQPDVTTVHDNTIATRAFNAVSRLATRTMHKVFGQHTPV